LKSSVGSDNLRDAAFGDQMLVAQYGKAFAHPLVRAAYRVWRLRDLFNKFRELIREQHEQAKDARDSRSDAESKLKGSAKLISNREQRGNYESKLKELIGYCDTAEKGAMDAIAILTKWQTAPPYWQHDDATSFGLAAIHALWNDDFAAISALKRARDAVRDKSRVSHRRHRAILDLHRRKRIEGISGGDIYNLEKHKTDLLNVRDPAAGWPKLTPSVILDEIKNEFLNDNRGKVDQRHEVRRLVRQLGFVIGNDAMGRPPEKRRRKVGRK
jgi:hypothetical protein